LIKKILELFGRGSVAVDLEADAQERARLDLEKARQSPLWARAVAFLKRNPMIAEWAREIQSEIVKARLGGANWVLPYHFNWGMEIRNLLRRGRYGEDEFAIENLDNIYAELVEEAVDL
jgi:hypothetical protein